MIDQSCGYCGKKLIKGFDHCSGCGRKNLPSDEQIFFGYVSSFFGFIVNVLLLCAFLALVLYAAWDSGGGWFIGVVTFLVVLIIVGLYRNWEEIKDWFHWW